MQFQGLGIISTAIVHAASFDNGACHDEIASHDECAGTCLYQCIATDSGLLCKGGISLDDTLVHNTHEGAVGHSGRILQDGAILNGKLTGNGGNTT